MKREIYRDYTRVNKARAKTAFKNNKTVIYWNENQLINDSTQPNYVENDTIFNIPKLKYFIVAN